MLLNSPGPNFLQLPQCDFIKNPLLYKSYGEFTQLKTKCVLYDYILVKEWLCYQNVLPKNFYELHFNKL